MHRTNKAVSTKLFDEVLNQGKPNLLNELIGVDYTDHDPVSGQLPGAAGIKGKLLALRRACPDIHFDLEGLREEGAAVAARYEWEGTHDGLFLGIQPFRKNGPGAGHGLLPAARCQDCGALGLRG